jgi:hypothetical protein
MPNLEQISERTALTIPLFNNIVKDATRLLSVSGSGLTISSGSITVAPMAGEGSYVVANEGSVAADDLDTITGGAAGDIITLKMTSGQVATLKNGTGNISTPGGTDFALSETLITMLRYNGAVWEVMGGGGSSGDQVSNTSYLTLTTSYQTLVSAPASGVRRIGAIELTNNDASVTPIFYIKIVRSGVDYMEIPVNIGPSQWLYIEFPFNLLPTDHIEAKISATCDAQASASFALGSGGMALVNFSGTSFTDVLTIPSGKKYAIIGILIESYYTASAIVGIQIEDGSAMKKKLKQKLLSAVTNYNPNIEKIVLPEAWKISVKHGNASATGSAVVCWEEV